jgi:hypothetical protein
MTSDDFDWEIEAMRLQDELFEARSLLRQLLSTMRYDDLWQALDEAREYLRIEE